MTIGVVGWVFIIIGVFLLTLFSSIAIIFYRKIVTQRVTKAYIIGDDATLDIINMKKIGDKFNHKGVEYVFDKRAVLKKIFQDHIFYFYNNPNPILFQSSDHKVTMTGRNLGNIIQHSLIDKLFGNKLDEFFSPQMIMMYVIIGGLAILLIMTFQNNGDVSLIANNQTINTIAQGVRSVIGGG